MARRGDKLREHILWVAKDVFPEVRFERASMDVVASRAETSKRSLYAHFESKEKLFLAVIDLVRGLFLNRLRMPEDYADQPAEALVLFCGRYLEILLYEASIQMCRVSVAETARFPEGAAQRLLGQVLYPRFPRALFGLDRLAERFHEDTLAPDFDVAPIRTAVADVIDSLGPAAARNAK